MSSKTKSGFIVALILTAAYFVQSRRDDARPVTPVRVQERVVHHIPSGSGREPAAAKTEPVSKLSASKAQIESLQKMAETLSDFSKKETRLVDLVSALERTRQEPVVSHDANDYTGEMAIVRTKHPLEGTRYFHAQYFTDENNQAFAQHISFEYKPGAQAMNEAVEAVRKSFPNLAEPKVKNGDFVEWDLDDHHVVWIKKMALEDLQNDPFNTYSPADVGTIRVAVETEIHGADIEGAAE